MSHLRITTISHVVQSHKMNTTIFRSITFKLVLCKIILCNTVISFTPIEGTTVCLFIDERKYCIIHIHRGYLYNDVHVSLMDALF